jgi:TPR repeat protein
MATPPALPAGDDRPSQRRVILAWIAVCAAVIGVVALFLAPLWPEAAEPAAVPEPALTADAVGETCLQLSQNSKEYLSGEAAERRQELRRRSCDMAFAAEPDNLQFKVAVARAMPHEQRAEKLAMLREAAAQGSAEAYFEIYESHKSWDRGDLDRVPMVPRAEADFALRKAAELGHPFSTQMLAMLLDRGTIVKRDPVAARYWAERALENPAQDTDRGSLQVFLGRLLTESDKPEERVRGLEMLERYGQPGYYQYGARTALAKAIRKQDPVRARKLLEEARSPDPGGATPPLAEMLIAGEGGPADPQRALKLLKAPRDTVGVKRVLGQVYLEGKLVPRDVQEAVRLIDMASALSLDARLQVLRLLAANPEVRVTHPKSTLYYAVEAAELDEPGAMTALIDLKLSANPQFQDRPGACKLIETAVSRGDQTMTPRLSECRAN